MRMEESGLLKLVGAPRVLGLVAPYTGKEIAEKRYCSRFVVPLESIND